MADERTKRLVDTSSRVILATHLEPSDDIKQERSKTSFDVQGLARYLNGGQAVLDTRYASPHHKASKLYAEIWRKG